jgi:hypothetical protein
VVEHRVLGKENPIHAFSDVLCRPQLQDGGFDRSGAGRFGAIVFAIAILLVMPSTLRRRISSRA